MRVLAPPPPLKAPHLWSTAAETDEQVGTLPVAPSRGAMLATTHHVRTPPELEDRVKPRAKKPACLPALRNTGRLDCRSAIGVVDDDDQGSEDDEEEGLISSPGGTCVPMGGVDPPASVGR